METTIGIATGIAFADRKDAKWVFRLPIVTDENITIAEVNAAWEAQPPKIITGELAMKAKAAHADLMATKLSHTSIEHDGETYMIARNGKYGFSKTLKAVNGGLYLEANSLTSPASENPDKELATLAQAYLVSEKKDFTALKWKKAELLSWAKENAEVLQTWQEGLGS